MCNIYISQSYYKTPKDIRLNCSHSIIFESPSKQENEAICNEQGLDKEAYMRGFEKEHNVLYIDKPRKITKFLFYEEL